jgi:glycerol-3-phosphate acyltransferase PlsY
MVVEIIFLVAAYLFGSFPLMLLVSKAKGVDLSQEGDYHIAMYRKVGRIAGVIGIAADVLKGILTVLVGYFLGFPIIITAASGVLATLGQMWPVFQRFNGEKGNTTGGGALFILCILYQGWWMLLVGLVVVAGGFLIRTIPRFLAPGQSFNEKLGFGGPPSNSLPLAMIIAFAQCPVLSWISGRPIELTLATLVIFIAIVIRRLTAGVRKDIQRKDSSVGSILCNRLLFDRSYY